MKKTRANSAGAWFFLALIVGQMVAQEPGLQESKIKVQWKGSTLNLTESGRLHAIPLDGQFSAAQIESVKLRSAKEGKGFIYLLLDVTGPSQFPRDNSKCGNGNESDLIWLKLDSAWVFKEGASFLYSSCNFPISVVDAPAWDGEIYRVKTNNQVATYNSTHPEAGLKIADTGAAK